MPPVTKMGISANWAAIIVPATVVAPSSCAAIIGAKSRLDAFITSRALARYCICSFVKPTVSWPFRIAIVAGVAPYNENVI